MKKGDLYKRRQEVINLPPTPLSVSKHEVEQNEIVALLYAPGSNGLPDVSLGYALGIDAKPELRQFVESNLYRPVGVKDSGCSDPDTALEMIVPFDMQLGRDRQAVGNYFLNKIKDLSKSKND